MVVKKGDKVKVEYTGTLDDGTVFDTNEGKEPLEFEAGSGQVIPGFDKAVVGMEKGEGKEITIKPDQAYGQPDENLKKKVPRESFPEDVKPEEGMMLAMNAPDGRQIPARVDGVGDKEVTLDLNHPLAGKTLNFKIKVM